ncbi:hypothetical protein, partial [Streptomyces toxytricini]|uniref:hypothetical protein n=1 Tax=Streptomyces toxytricini TaxID=67369 RepID=UPI00344A1308
DAQLRAKDIDMIIYVSCTGFPQQPQAAARPAGEDAGPSPEQARDRMAAYRAGWARGAQEKPARPGGEGDTG